MFVSYSTLLAGLVNEAAEAVSRTAAIGFGLALVPFVFVSLAFLSRHRMAPSAVLKSLGLWLVIALPIGLGSVVLGLMLGFGAGGMVSLRAEKWHMRRARAVALAAALLYTVLLLLVAPALGLVSAGTLPLVAIGLADTYSDHRHEQAA